MNVLTTISVAAAKALLRVIDMDDERKHLHGVWFGNDGRAMATNGHILVAVGGLQAIVGAQVFIHHDELKDILKGAKPKATLGICDDGLYVESRRVLKEPLRALGELQPPPWIRIVPTSFNGHMAEFDSELMERFRRILETLEVLEDGAIPVLYTNGPGRCAMAKTPDHVMALIMPLMNSKSPPDPNEGAAQALRFLGT